MKHFILTALFVSLLGGQAFVAEPIPSWTQWRGNNREATNVALPKTFTEKPEIVWQKTMDGDGIAGVVGNSEVVIVADRNRLDSTDIFRCFDMKTGNERWKLEYPATSKLDFGNSPRATPLIAEDKAFLLGASGHLHAVELSTGKIVWQTTLRKSFNCETPHWGFTTSPLLIDGKLIVPPGALDAASGNVVWKSENAKTAGYASPILYSPHPNPLPEGEGTGKRQIIMYDSESLGGWDIATGKRLWELIPRFASDFNVPTPIQLDDNRLFVVTENNGARIYRFDKDGKIEPQPIAVQKEITPDSNSAVASGNRIYIVDSGLHCLDATDLKILWTLEDKVLNDYATLILGEERLLIGTYSGEVLLVDITASPGKIVGRFRPFAEDDVMLSHPAVIGKFLVLRSTSVVVCVRFPTE
jgi:outer membrane protein assembly factor BamB